MNSDFRLFRYLPRLDTTTQSAVTIGNFDGVHLGHQAILAQVCTQAKQQNLVPTVMTFSPHPRAYFAGLANKPELAPSQINSLRDKLILLKQFGIQQVVLQRFNAALASMQAEDFILNLLVKGLNTRWLLVGEDFRYGHKRSGDIDLLRKLGQKHGFQVNTIADINDSTNNRISSSKLRLSLADGDLPKSIDLLGYNYRISGHVLHGLKLGRKLGFPTINLKVPENCALGKGIYVVKVHGLGSNILPGVASLGIRPTVTSDGALLLETHILDHEVDAYGKLVCIEFLKFLRNEQSFPDLTTLSAAIKKDAQDARYYFTSHGL